MSKKYKYTIITLFLAFVFAFGSMVGMNLILQGRERQLLTERGRAVVEAPVRAWQEQESGEEGEKDENFDNERDTLTTVQIEDVISSWNNRIGETIHNPVSGQISMEEAIKAGEEWLINMGDEEENEKGTGTEAYSVNAALGVGMQKESVGVQLEPYYSFWTVQFSNESMKVVLYLNAVTGKVWKAEIVLNKDLQEGLSFEKLNLFVELAGLQKPNAEMITDQEGTRTILDIEGSRLFAEAEIEYAKKRYNDVNNDSEMLHNEYAVIVYELTVSQK